MNKHLFSRLFEEAGEGTDLPGAPAGENNESDFGDILDNESRDGSVPVAAAPKVSVPASAAQQPEPTKPGPVLVPPQAPSLPSVPVAQAPTPAPVPAGPPAQPVAAPPTAASAAGVPAPAPETVEAYHAKLQEVKGRAAAEIAQSYASQLTQQDIFELQNNPEVALPKMAGKLYTDVYESVFASMEAMLPQKIMTALQVQENARRNDSDFFKSFPDLQKPEFHNDIRQTALLFMQSYPQWDRTQLINGIGTFLRQRHGLNAPAQPPATPQRVQQAPAQRPFIPAAAGNRGGGPPQQLNDIEQFMDELTAIGE